MTFDEFKLLVKNIETTKFKITDLGDCIVVDCQTKVNYWGGTGDKWFIHDDGSIMLVVDNNKPCMSVSVHLREYKDFDKIMNLINFLK